MPTIATTPFISKEPIRFDEAVQVFFYDPSLVKTSLPQAHDFNCQDQIKTDNE